ncbi:hypothetical protein G6F31_021804 [Rhizopus arrhizus]|nr:hypothetical protein G6F31_021804 [Rhizopus arrhizus]
MARCGPRPADGLEPGRGHQRQIPERARRRQADGAPPAGCRSGQARPAPARHEDADPAVRHRPGRLGFRTDRPVARLDGRTCHRPGRTAPNPAGRRRQPGVEHG